MATETTIEAARTRIQRLVEQIAALSKADMPSDEFFAKFLERVVAASDAKGGAVWLVGTRAQDNKSEFQLCAQVDFASSLFQSDEAQRTALLKILTDVVRGKTPVIFSPTPGAQTEMAAPAGGMVNRAPYPFLHVPLLTGGQAIGVLQVWLQPYVQPANFAEFITFLSTLTPYVDQHLQSRRLSNLVLETQRLQHLLRFTADLAGSLQTLEVSRLTANYGRDLAGCERTSVLLKEGDRWKVLAISGQETVEPKSSMVKAMAAFVEAHVSGETRILDKKELLERAEAKKVEESASPALLTRTTDEVDLLYFQLSHVVSAIICPLKDSEGEIAGAIFCESTFEGYFNSAGGKSEVLPARRVTEWMATYAGRALLASQDYETIPFLPVTRRIRNARLLLTGKKRHRVLLKLGIVGGLAALVLIWPARVNVDGDCGLQALHRALVVPQITARVESVQAREGDAVKAGQVLAQLDTRRLQLDMESTEQEKLRYLADADRIRATGDEAGAQVSLLQVKVLEQQEKKEQADIDSGTLRSPIDGVIMTKDLELRAGEVLQPGTPFAEVDGLQGWQLRMEVNERDISTVEEALKEKGKLDLTYILYSQSTYTLRAQLTSRQQISAVAYPREKENVFVITIDNPSIPPEVLKNIRPGLTGRAKLELGRRPRLFSILRTIARWFQFRMIG